MDPKSDSASLAHRVLVPGGTGAVGEGIVRAFLRAGADVVVPTRSAARSAEFLALLGADASEHLHLVVHDYTGFAGAEALVATMLERLGGIDDVVAPIGGWWAGGPLATIGRSDWDAAFVELATTHTAVARAALPRMSGDGFYGVVVGESAEHPVPGSGLVSMEQAAVLMLQRVLAAESQRPVHALVLGPVATRAVAGEPTWVSSDAIGAVAVALAKEPGTSRTIALPDAAAAARVLGDLTPSRAVVTASTFVPKPGKGAELATLLAELQEAIRAEPGNLGYDLHPAVQGDGILVIQRFVSPDAFRAHSAAIARVDGPRRLGELVDGALTPPRLFAA